MITNFKKGAAEVVGEATGLASYHYLPQRISPPMVAVQPGTPYLTDGDTYGSTLLGLEVHIIWSAINNEASSDGLDAAIEAAVEALNEAGWNVTQVSQPFAAGQAGAPFLVVAIEINQSISL